MINRSEKIILVMTEERANKVYTILVNLGGAREAQRKDFVYHHTIAKYLCDEWRFGGKLGFGGKYRRRRNMVDYYQEDETDEINELVDKINIELSKIK